MLLGALAPPLRQALFPPVAQQQAMLDALAQLGILLLLLVTEAHNSASRPADRCGCWLR
ncbi:MAG: hypothetical protein JO158_07670 [Gammaproteobacteria bacterium]|nr:hypothetical protein [Gammaproteobacteria bacterium]MBV9723819.1 hypothetical protein [Gammaproteobacteria bacterium]